MKKIITLGLMLFLVCAVAAFAGGGKESTSGSAADAAQQSLEGFWAREDGGDIRMVEFWVDRYDADWVVRFYTFDPNRRPIHFDMFEEGNTVVWPGNEEMSEFRVGFSISGNTLTLSGEENLFGLSFVGVYTKVEE